MTLPQDEVFHGPQAREYCRGAFSSWHPKITTFPGVYYLGAVYGWARWLVQAGMSGGQGPTVGPWTGKSGYPLAHLHVTCYHISTGMEARHAAGRALLGESM